MSASRQDPKASVDHEVNIAKSWLGRHRSQLIALVALIMLVVAITIISTSWDPGVRERAGPDWGLLAKCIAIGWGAVFVAAMVVQYLSCGWLRAARLPAKRMAKGNIVGAEVAFEAALTRAARFSGNDPRRGVMLYELAGYAKFQGRYEQAKNLFAESVAILTAIQKTQPLHYFITLNNFGLFLIDAGQFEDAQRMLERAIDLLPMMKKSFADQGVIYGGYAIHEIELILNLNLVYLFTKTGLMDEAGLRLRECEALFAQIKKRRRKHFHDYLVGQRGLWKCAAGDHAGAWNDCEQALDAKNDLCLHARAKVQLSRQEYASAEATLRLIFEAARTKGTLHRPDLLDHTLELAESLFGQSKHAEAFETLEESRRIVADYHFPTTPSLRRALQTWLQRAKELGRVELTTSLEKELQAAAAPPLQAITILDKFRLHPQAPG